MNQRFIVAEVSKSYVNGEPQGEGLLSQRFEQIIAVNLNRGYQLHEWKMCMAQVELLGNLHHNETIVAVFEYSRYLNSSETNE